MATFTKRNGKWQAKIRKRGQRTLTKSFTLLEDAERWARKTESELERGLYLEDIEEARATTVKDAAARFTSEHIEKLRHGDREKNRLLALLDRTGWGSLSLTSLKGKEIASYVRKREKEGAKPDTIRLDLALLSRLFKHARQDWGMESLRNPVESVRKPSLRGTARARRLEEGEEEKLLAAAKKDFRPVIIFALETAMRREEISSLTWEDIDLNKRTAHLSRTKNGEARTVPLSTKAIELLKGIDISPRSCHVFQLTKDQITTRMISTVKRANLENLRFHDIRHEATSRLFEKGTLDMMEIATITGHKTLHMLQRYTHLRAEDLVSKLS